MTCRDFERTWNELFDLEAGAGVGRRAASAGGVGKGADHGGACVAQRERALLEHQAECPSCGLKGVRYQALRIAIREWGPPPAPPAGLADRILAEIERPRPSAWPIDRVVGREPRWSLVAGLAAITATAAALAIALAHLNRTLDRPRPNGPPPALEITQTEPDSKADVRSLNTAVSEATAATLDLARSASEPAARISRQVLDAATRSERNPTEAGPATASRSVAAAVSIPSLDSLAPDPAGAGAVLQEVGDHLTNSVRPLSDTARQAFGFLLGTALAKPLVPTHSPAQKGA